MYQGYTVSVMGSGEFASLFAGVNPKVLFKMRYKKKLQLINPDTITPEAQDPYLSHQPGPSQLQYKLRTKKYADIYFLDILSMEQVFCTEASVRCLFSR